MENGRSGKLRKIRPKKNEEKLDTSGILNGKGTLWTMLGYDDTIAVLVSDFRKGAAKWACVTVYSNQERQHTVPIDILIEEYPYFKSNVLVNENTLLLSCGWNK